MSLLELRDNEPCVQFIFNSHIPSFCHFVVFMNQSIIDWLSQIILSEGHGGSFYNFIVIRLIYNS